MKKTKLNSGGIVEPIEFPDKSLFQISNQINKEVIINKEQYFAIFRHLGRLEPDIEKQWKKLSTLNKESDK